jgi:hypothetical protein
MYDLAEAVGNEIVDFIDFDLAPAFRDASWDIADHLASTLDYMMLVTDYEPTVNSNTSSLYQCTYTGSAGDVIISIYGTGVDKLFGGSYAIGQVSITEFSFSYPDASFVFDIKAASPGIVIDFGSDNATDAFSGQFTSFELSTPDFSIIAEGAIDFDIDLDADAQVNGTLSSLTISYLAVPEHYTLSLGGDIQFSRNASGDISLEGSRFSSFSISESGNYFTYMGDFTYYGDLDTGHVAGSVTEIKLAVAGVSFVLKGDIEVDDNDVSGYITDLTIHADGINSEGTPYDATYSFAGKHVDILDLFEAGDDTIRDINGDGKSDEYDLVDFMLNHIDGATLTGLNLPPHAMDDEASTDNLTALMVDTAHGLLANDSDWENDVLLVSNIEFDGKSYTVGETHIIDDWDGTPVASFRINADGSYEFTPLAYFSTLLPGESESGSIDYTVIDTSGNTSLYAKLTLTVTNPGDNHAPTSTDDSVTIAATDTQRILALTDFGVYDDVDGTDISAVKISALPAVGSLMYTTGGSTWNPAAINQVFSSAEITAGHLKYVPGTGMTSDVIGFKVSDGVLFSPGYTLTVYAESVETLNDGDTVGEGGTTVDLPTGVIVESSTLGTGLGTAEQLYAFVDSNGQPGVIASQELIHQQIDDYIAEHPGTQTVHELILSNATPGQTITIDCDPSGDEVMVIDASALPHGTVIDLNNIGFAIIIGPGHYEGGAGSNIIVANGGNQYIVLGPEDDTIDGGAGDDTIGSQGGDDHLKGGSGNDLLFGGADNDDLDGGSGTDTVRFQGDYADYLFDYDNDTSAWTVQDTVNDRDGVDTVTGAEVFRFSDGDHVAAAHDCTVDVTYWKNGAAIDGVTSTITDTGNDQQTAATATGGGQYIYTGLIEGEYTLEVEKGVGSAEKSAIDTDDAIAILKSIVGLIDLSEYQSIAANYDGSIDQNGAPIVDTDDAIGVLKHIVSLPSPEPAWVFVDGELATPDPTADIVVNMQADHDSISLVGVLVGDVDGSWTPDVV